MKIFKELNKKGYKHYYKGTIQELDSMDKKNPDLHSEIMHVLMWLLKKHKLWIYVKKEGGWWFPVIENYYDEDDQGTIQEDISKMDHSYTDHPIEVYKYTIEYCLKELI